MADWMHAFLVALTACHLSRSPLLGWPVASHHSTCVLCSMYKPSFTRQKRSLPSQKSTHMMRHGLGPKAEVRVGLLHGVESSQECYSMHKRDVTYIRIPTPTYGRLWACLAIRWQLCAFSDEDLAMIQNKWACKYLTLDHFDLKVVGARSMVRDCAGPVDATDH